LKRGESGPANIFDAAAVAVSPDARERGVLIVMHGDINSARRVTKIDTSAVDAFESVMPPDLGTVRSGLVEFSAAWSPRVHVPLRGRRHGVAPGRRHLRARPQPAEGARAADGGAGRGV
jgi:hypothetical protein